MQPFIPSVTVGSQFALFVPIFVRNDRGTAVPALASDLTNCAASVRAYGSTQWEQCSATAVAGGFKIHFAANDLDIANYYDLRFAFDLRGKYTTALFLRAFEVVTTVDRVCAGNCTTRPAILSNYGTTDTVLEERIAALRQELSTAVNAKQAAMSALTRKNVEYANLSQEYNRLLEEYNELIDHGGGDTTPIPGADEWGFYDPDRQVVGIPTMIWQVLYLRTQLETVPDFDLEEVAVGYMFERCVRLTSFTNTHIKRISGGYIFSNCSQLQSVNLPQVTSISGGYTFSGCSQLQSVNLPQVTSISGSATFSACSQLLRLIVPECTSISAGNNSCFSGVTRLAYIKMGAATLSFSLSSWNPTYWTGTPSAEDIAELIDLATEQWEEQNTTDPYPGRANNAIDALAVLFYLGIISRIRDLRGFGENVTSTLTLNATFKQKLATSPLWSGYVAEANTKGWSIA